MPQTIAPSVIVIFQLVPNGKDSHRLLVINLKQGHIARCTKWNDQLAKKRITRTSFAITEWRKRQTTQRIFYSLKRPGSQRPIRVILCQNELIKPNQIRFGLFRKPNLKTHRPAFAASSMPSSRPSTASALTYSPVCRASSRERKPRAMKSR